MRTLVLDIDGWTDHRAGQHLDVRLTAEDGYRAERSYSIATAPGEPPAITVERLDDGEVSPYLTEVVRPGDAFDVRGPIGGYFIWEPEHAGPLLLVGGGSGIVPLRAMLRHHHLSRSDIPVRLVLSARTQEDLIYREELEQPDGNADVVLTLTRAQPPGWPGYTQRVDTELLRKTAWPAGERPLAFVCGPTSFVEAVAGSLVALGYESRRVKTERFGAAGSP